MKVALVTTSPSIPSGIGDYTRHLVPYLREHCDVRVFIEPGAPADPDASPADRLVPREFDRILYQLGNERAHAFMAPMVRTIGGTVMLHDWVLFDLACAAWPGLTRGGIGGHALALREGGPAQLGVYLRNWLDRRRQRDTPRRAEGCAQLPGRLLCGWHEPEERGRWTADAASLRLPSEDVAEVEIRLHVDGGRSVRLTQDGRTIAGLDPGAEVLGGAVADPRRPLLVIETEGIRVTQDQRSHGDSRRLGCFVMGVCWRDGAGWHELDLQESSTRPILPVSLSRDRFELPLNRSVVRFGDAFIVHSRHVADRILSERNAATPIGILHHGAERRWRSEDRRETRRRIGLPADWVDGFLVVSFGGVQRHKRIERILEGVHRARREREDVRLVLAGRMEGDGFDAPSYASKLGLGDVVRFTGFVREEEAWDWIHAGDVCVNLRGPTSGGTSGGIFQSLSLGRPVIASDAAEQRELPESCIVKVPLGDGEVDALARTLVQLRDDPDRREALERASREFVERECHWGITARQYADYLEGFPPPRAARRSLIVRGLGLVRGRGRASPPGRPAAP